MEIFQTLMEDMNFREKLQKKTNVLRNKEWAVCFSLKRVPNRPVIMDQKTVHTMHFETYLRSKSSFKKQ